MALSRKEVESRKIIRREVTYRIVRRFGPCTFSTVVSEIFNYHSDLYPETKGVHTTTLNDLAALEASGDLINKDRLYEVVA